MSAFIPTIVAVLAAVALLLALLFFWQSLRFLFGGTGGPAQRSDITVARRQLLEEKVAILSSLREVELDRGAGKISLEDAKVLEAQLRTDAKRVMRALDDDLGDFLLRARTLVNDAISQVAAPKAPVGAAKICEACKTSNDSDAAYCKKCAASLDAPKEQPE